MERRGKKKEENKSISYLSAFLNVYLGDLMKFIGIMESLQTQQAKNKSIIPRLICWFYFKCHIWSLQFQMTVAVTVYLNITNPCRD